MDTRHLCEDAAAYNGFVGRNGNAAIALHQMAHLVQFLLVDVSYGIEVVLQDGLHTGQRCIAGPLTQSVDSSVQSPAATEYGSQHIADSQVVVIVGMEV